MIALGPLTTALLKELVGEFPNFRIVRKSESPLSFCIDWGLRLVTLGGQRSYRNRYHTVIGSTLYVCPSWQTMSDVQRVILLRHERVHLRQRRRFSFPVFACIYLFVWLPLGLSWGRARLEWEAYTETLRATDELLGRPALQSALLREEIVRRFTGPDYGWMWPFRASVERWYDQVLEEICTAPLSPSSIDAMSVFEGTAGHPALAASEAPPLPHPQTQELP